MIFINHRHRSGGVEGDLRLRLRLRLVVGETFGKRV